MYVMVCVKMRAICGKKYSDEKIRHQEINQYINSAIKICNDEMSDSCWGKCQRDNKREELLANVCIYWHCVYMKRVDRGLTPYFERPQGQAFVSSGDRDTRRREKEHTPHLNGRFHLHLLRIKSQGIFNYQFLKMCNRAKLY